METGAVTLIDAHRCDAGALRSIDTLAKIFTTVVAELGLHPVGEAHWHRFPGPGGITGFLVLSESHLSCHTFPESGFAAFDLYCCRELADWPWEERLRDILGAGEVNVVRVARGRVPVDAS